MDEVFDDRSPEAGADDDPSADERPAEPRPRIDYEPTGVDSVDRVLAEVAAVADRPVGEHVEVFERAHEQLRRALDARLDASPGASPDASPGGGQGA